MPHYYHAYYIIMYVQATLMSHRPIMCPMNLIKHVVFSMKAAHEEKMSRNDINNLYTLDIPYHLKHTVDLPES